MGHLSFTEILDTSLKVSWQEPVEKNGIITGISCYLCFFFCFLFSVCGVECVVAVENCVMEHLGRIWAIAAFLAPPLGN